MKSIPDCQGTYLSVFEAKSVLDTKKCQHVKNSGSREYPDYVLCQLCDKIRKENNIRFESFFWGIFLGLNFKTYF